MGMRMEVKLGLRVKLFGAEPARWALSLGEFDMRGVVKAMKVAARHSLRAREFMPKVRFGRAA